MQKFEKVEETLRKKVAKLEKRKAAAEDKYLDGEWSKEQYHEAIERLYKELAGERSKIHQLIKEHGGQESLSLKEVFKLIRFETLDREILQALVKRIDVNEGGKVIITYNFVV